MMKKLISFMICFLLSIFVFAQEGVNFEQLTFAEALAKAKAENKLVFVDCYTSWCGPCKYMTTKIFPLEKAGEFFNPRFVCVKFDMEKGEGKELKTKLGVKAFPSFFIIRPDGTVQHSVVGGGELDSFVEKIKLGLNEKTSLLYLNQQYEKGKMNKKQLMTYYTALINAYDEKKAEKVRDELMSQLTEKDKLKADFWAIFEDSGCVVGSTDFNLILANIRVFEKNIGKEELDNYLYKAYEQALTPYLNKNKKKQKISLDELKKQIDKLNITQKEILVFQYQLAKAVSDNDNDKIVVLAEEKAAELNEQELWIVLGALRNIEDKAYYPRIVALGEKVIANPANSEMKDYLEVTFEDYKKMTHVGVYFEDLTFEQALEKAKKQQRMIFMDCYTSWCGPCKYMSSTIFPQEKVGDLLNHFVCVKYDMEKGEGPELAKKFGVRAYPTFVIINPEGIVMHKMVGGGEADEFLERVQEAFDEKKATGILDQKYKEGNREKDFLVQYINSLISLYSPEAPEVAAELYLTLTDEEKTSKDYWFLFENEELIPEGYDYVLAHREKFDQKIGKEKVDARLATKYKNKIMLVLSERDVSQTVEGLEQMKKEVMALKLNNEKSLIGQINIAKAFLGQNTNQLLVACEKEVNQIPAEEYPIMLVYKVKSSATPQQMKRWVKICRQVIANCKNEKYAEWLGGFVKTFEEK